MKKLGFLWVSILFLWACSPQSDAQSTKVVAADAPIMTFEKEVFDFGKIKEGEQVAHQFTFTNTGKTALLIESASATCGCTVPEYPKEAIQPGGKGVIKAVFSSAGRVGLNDKVITINSNAKQVKLHVIGEVISK